MTGARLAAEAARALVLDRTRPQHPPVVPELRLHLADDMDALWAALQGEQGPATEPPYWAFAWLGGQAVARHVLDAPALVAGRRVLDLATGSGLCALAARLAGAAAVTAVDVDPVAVQAVRLNAALNGLEVQARCADLLDGPPPEVDVVLAGDVFYDAGMAARVSGWLAAARAASAQVLVGDPGRHYLPQARVTPVGAYDVPTTRALEGVTLKRVRVYAFDG